ncbi:MAG: ABC transporter ATP-binding protein [Acidobacteria bacterium]|nr:MAG: ABC transporter ATP-binding protein [Acidobacteriota bacterium]TDI45644.1 MAG: ABC transporter ATP-binding protein [Acidobacteriota bacterium]
MSDDTPVLSARGLVKTFASGGGRLTILNGCDLDVARGELLAVVGPSGVGKSTLLHILGGLDRPDAGRVLLDGRDLASLSPDQRADTRNRSIGFVFQFHHLMPDFTAEENIMMPLLVGRLPHAQARERAREVMDELGLGHRAHHTPAQLSGGERQRVAIGRALVQKPAVLLADEPTGNLDPRTAGKVFDALEEAQKRRKLAVILVTHARELANRCDRIASLAAGGFDREGTGQGAAGGMTF